MEPVYWEEKYVVLAQFKTLKKEIPRLMMIKKLLIIHNITSMFWKVLSSTKKKIT